MIPARAIRVPATAASNAIFLTKNQAAARGEINRVSNPKHATTGI